MQRQVIEFPFIEPEEKSFRSFLSVLILHVSRNFPGWDLFGDKAVLALDDMVFVSEAVA